MPGKLLESLQRQQRTYAETHASVVNLLIHVVAVPVFLGGNGLLLLALLQGSALTGAVGIALMVSSLSAQACGHRLEARRPEKFCSIADAVARLLCEQWVTFPLYMARYIRNTLAR